MPQIVTTETEWQYPARKLGLYERTVSGNSTEKKVLIVFLDEHGRGWKGCCGPGELPPPSIEADYRFSGDVVRDAFRCAQLRTNTQWENADQEKLLTDLQQSLQAIQSVIRLCSERDNHGFLLRRFFGAEQVIRDKTAFVGAAFERIAQMGPLAALDVADELKRGEHQMFADDLFKHLGVDFIATQLTRIQASLDD